MLSAWEQRLAREWSVSGLTQRPENSKYTSSTAGSFPLMIRDWTLRITRQVFLLSSPADPKSFESMSAFVLPLLTAVYLSFSQPPIIQARVDQHTPLNLTCVSQDRLKIICPILIRPVATEASKKKTTGGSKSRTGGGQDYYPYNLPILREEAKRQIQRKGRTEQTSTHHQNPGPAIPSLALPLFPAPGLLGLHRKRWTATGSLTSFQRFGSLNLCALGTAVLGFCRVGEGCFGASRVRW